MIINSFAMNSYEFLFFVLFHRIHNRRPISLLNVHRYGRHTVYTIYVKLLSPLFLFLFNALRKLVASAKF